MTRELTRAETAGNFPMPGTRRRVNIFTLGLRGPTYASVAVQLRQMQPKEGNSCLETQHYFLAPESPSGH